MSLSLQLKRHDRFNNFHVIVRKKLAFVLKLYSFGLSLTMLQDPLKYQNSKFGYSMTVPGTMVTNYTDTYGSNIHAPWWVWRAKWGKAHGSSQRATGLASQYQVEEWHVCVNGHFFPSPHRPPLTYPGCTVPSVTDGYTDCGCQNGYFHKPADTIKAQRNSGLSSLVTISTSVLLYQQVFEV